MSEVRGLRLTPSAVLKERRLAALLGGRDPADPRLGEAGEDAQILRSLELARRQATGAEGLASRRGPPPPPPPQGGGGGLRPPAPGGGGGPPPPRLSPGGVPVRHRAPLLAPRRGVGPLPRRDDPVVGVGRPSVTALLALPPGLVRVFDALRAAGGRPFLVGGAVRDAILGLSTTDFDVEVYGLPAERVREVLGAAGRG